MATVKHVKNVLIADDPAVVAAGGVVPSDWNANHTVTLAADENFVTDAEKTLLDSGVAPVYHSHTAGVEGEPAITAGSGTVNVASATVWFVRLFHSILYQLTPLSQYQ
jgi:hypothetical protein